jgi:hypothetical protein
MKIVNILFLLVLCLGCSKDEQPEPTTQTQTTTAVENNYLLTVQEIGSLSVYHRIELNGIEKTSNAFNVKTGDVLSGWSYTVASNGNTIGIIVDLDGSTSYSNTSYKAQNDTLFHNYQIN